MVVTLVYLTTQIRQNTSAIRTSSRQDLSASYRAMNDHLLDADICEAYALGIRDYPNMPVREKRAFSHAINDHTLFFQSAFALFDTGALEKENYEPYLIWLSSHLATPGGSAWWREAGQFYNTAMVSALDARLAEGDLPDVMHLGFFALDDRAESRNR